MFDYVYSYFFSSQKDEDKNVKDSKQHSQVDSHLLLWDIRHLSYHELENKYQAKYSTISNILRGEGIPIYKTDINKVQRKLITIPVEFKPSRVAIL